MNDQARTQHYERRDDGFYSVWSTDFNSDEPGERKLESGLGFTIELERIDPATQTIYLDLRTRPPHCDVDGQGKCKVCKQFVPAAKLKDGYFGTVYVDPIVLHYCTGAPEHRASCTTPFMSMGKPVCTCHIEEEETDEEICKRLGYDPATAWIVRHPHLHPDDYPRHDHAIGPDGYMNEHRRALGIHPEPRHHERLLRGPTRRLDQGPELQNISPDFPTPQDLRIWNRIQQHPANWGPTKGWRQRIEDGPHLDAERGTEMDETPPAENRGAEVWDSLNNKSVITGRIQSKGPNRSNGPKEAHPHLHNNFPEHIHIGDHAGYAQDHWYATHPLAEHQEVSSKEGSRCTGCNRTTVQNWLTGICPRCGKDNTKIQIDTETTFGIAGFRTGDGFELTGISIRANIDPPFTDEELEETGKIIAAIMRDKHDEELAAAMGGEVLTTAHLDKAIKVIKESGDPRYAETLDFGKLMDTLTMVRITRLFNAWFENDSRRQIQRCLGIVDSNQKS